MKHLGLVLCLGFLAFTCPVARATEVTLNSDRAYDFEWQGVIPVNSPIDIYVANNLDPLRWKDWSIIIGVPVGYNPITHITVDYDNSSDHTDPFVLLPVDLALYGTINIGPVTYNAYYASTWEQQWEQFGTLPAGGTGQFPYVGNPAWVSFHFDVDEDPLVIIKDKCIPEPATVALLGLGAMALLRKRS